MAADPRLRTVGPRQLEVLCQQPTSEVAIHLNPFIDPFKGTLIDPFEGTLIDPFKGTIVDPL